MTAPFSAWMKATVGLVERITCSACRTRGCWFAAAIPVKTTVLTTPETQTQRDTNTALFTPSRNNERQNKQN